MFEGQDPGGPVPLFFTPDRTRARERMHANQEQLRKDISSINATILRMEHMSLEEAYRYLQGKARAARGVMAFPPIMGPPTRKRKQSPATPRETGTALASVFPPTYNVDVNKCFYDLGSLHVVAQCM